MRISTPPVRDASTKPTAATVLPAPVACSNQKRLPAFGSSGASATSCLVGRALVPVLRLLGLVLVVELLLARDADRRELGRLQIERERRRRIAGLEPIREQRGQRAREGVDLVGGEDRAVDELRLVLREQAIEAEQQRPLAAPVGRGHLRARLELHQGSVERTPAGGPGRQRAADFLPLGEEWLAGER